jgi:hypothetical protein
MPFSTLFLARKVLFNTPKYFKYFPRAGFSSQGTKYIYIYPKQADARFAKGRAVTAHAGACTWSCGAGL